MDGEIVQRSRALTRLHVLLSLSEVDKETEAIRAQKYRRIILSQLGCEDADASKDHARADVEGNANVEDIANVEDNVDVRGADANVREDDPNVGGGADVDEDDADVGEEDANAGEDDPDDPDYEDDVEVWEEDTEMGGDSGVGEEEPEPDVVEEDPDDEGDEEPGDAAHHPQAASAFTGTSSAYRTMAMPVLSTYFARAGVPVTIPQAQPAPAEITEISTDGGGLRAGGSTSTHAVNSAGRKRRRASEGELARSSKRARPLSSRSDSDNRVTHLASITIRAVQNQQMTQTDNQRNDQRSIPPSTSDLSLVLRVQKPIDATSMADVFSRVGLIPCKLTTTRDEAACIEETPRIMWRTLTKRFGTRYKVEWQECEKIPQHAGGTKKFFFAHLVTQPYMPTAPGNPGVILRPPGWTAQDDDHTFQVFSPMHDGDNFQYCGEYTTVSNVHIELKWADLPPMCRTMWLQRFRRAIPYRALRARINLRRQLKREPSTIEVRESLQTQENIDEITRYEVSTAFRAEEETMVFECIRCTRYEYNLAKIIQNNGVADDHQT